MNVEAYWISPAGKTFTVPRHHIDQVIEHPGVFGLTRAAIEAEYAKHREPLHWEGFAREKIMARLIEKGWMRVRYRHRTDSFMIEVNEISDKVMRRLKKWAQSLDSIANHSAWELSEINAGRGTVSGLLRDLRKNSP